MKKLIITSLVITACLSTNVMAKHNSNYDYARVVKATPVYDYVTHRVPVQTCGNDGHYQVAPKHDAVVPTVVGGIIGGVVGHSIGSDRKGKRLGMVTGTIVGATIGANVGTGGHYHSPPSCHCTVSYHIEQEPVLAGFDVIYIYHGHKYHTYTRQHPGSRIRVAVNVVPDRGLRIGHHKKISHKRGLPGRRH